MTAANEIELQQVELAQMAARSERYVGTMAGGIDQAASALGRRGHALFVEFDPLRALPVPIPGNAMLVVADSLERADKSRERCRRNTTAVWSNVPSRRGSSEKL